MITTNVIAEWTKVTDSKDGETNVYIDYGTIKKKGNKVKMWSLIDYKTVQKIKFKNDNFLSSLSRQEYDCEEETTRVLDLYLYSGNMKTGNNLFSYSNIKDEPASTRPDTIESVFYKIACHKK